MAAPFTFTFTGKAGAGNTVTATAFTNITGFSYDNNTSVLTLNQQNGNPLILAYGGSTWTITVSSGAITAASAT